MFPNAGYAMVDQPRSTQRYRKCGNEEEREIVKRLRELSREHPRHGYRFMTALLRREGMKINRKRVHRLWREAGLKVPHKTVKKRRLGGSENAYFRRRAERPNQVWSYDFVMDQTSDGRRLKILGVVDEYTRECLALEVEQRMEAVDVIEVLRRIMGVRGAPKTLFRNWRSSRRLFLEPINATSDAPFPKRKCPTSLQQ